MSLVGLKLEIAGASDPTKRGRRGTVLLETANTLLLQSGAKRIGVETAGSSFVRRETNEAICGDDVAGRLEDRLKEWKR